MCTRPLLMHMRIDATKVAAAVLMASNCRETVNLLLTTLIQKGFNRNHGNPSGPPLVHIYMWFSQACLWRA